MSVLTLFDNAAFQILYPKGSQRRAKLKPKVSFRYSPHWRAAQVSCPLWLISPYAVLRVLGHVALSDSEGSLDYPRDLRSAHIVPMSFGRNHARHKVVNNVGFSLCDLVELVMTGN